MSLIHEDNGLASFTSGNSGYAGRYLKSASGWIYSTNGDGTDKYGFAALPGGRGDSGGSFSFAGYSGYWWSASEGGANSAYFRYMDYNSVSANLSNDYKHYLFSVRCVQD